MTSISYRQAIRMAFEDSLRSHEDLKVIGQGVWNPWYVGGSMDELDKEFGRDRIIDTPVSEDSVTGVALGIALAGGRSIVVHPRMDFMVLAANQIINQIAKWSDMFGEEASPNVTIRSIINRGGSQGAQHSQALHSMFAHVPGLEVLMPASVDDAYKMLRYAVRANRPVLYIDDRWLYDLEMSETEFRLKCEDRNEFKSKIVADGESLTVVSSGHFVQVALQARDELMQCGNQIEVIDIRSVKPLYLESIITSVEKTGRLLVVDGGWSFCGLGGEVIASVVERVDMTKLQRNPMRISLPEVAAPASKILEADYYPSADSLVKTIQTLL